MTNEEIMQSATDINNVIISATKPLLEKIKVLQDKNDSLKAALKRINIGLQHEYGHSDSDRYNRAILQWNKIIVEAFKDDSIIIEQKKEENDN